MRPIRNEQCNQVLGAPPNWDDEERGECSPLPVRKEANSYTSYWKPTAEELAALNAGKPVRLTVIGGAHPPVSMEV